MAERRPSAATGASMNATGFTPGSSAAGDGGVAHQRRQHGSTASISNQPFITAPRMSYSAPSGPTSQFAAPTRAAGQDGSAATTVKNVANKIEEMMDTYSHPIKPYLPAIGRFLIVSTFLEDAWRMLTQWSDQKYYLQRHRGFPWGTSQMFLFLNIVLMSTCSVLIISRKYPEISVAGLLFVVLLQGFGYGLIFDINFFLRNLSVVGGLLMVFSESMSKRKNIFAGIPSLSEDDRKTYFQLAGRILLIFLFLGFVFNGKMTVMRAIISLFGLGACGMIAVGFKAKLSALFLTVVLSIINLFLNNFWSISSAHPQRDFLRYDFFQTLSIVGGLLLLVNMGAGSMSLDAKKRS